MTGQSSHLMFLCLESSSSDSLLEPTLKMANKAMPVIRHPSVKANRMKEGTQHVFFHFFPVVEK